MNPMKVYSSFGDAGFVATNDNKIYKKLLSLRYAGTINKEYFLFNVEFILLSHLLEGPVFEA